MQKDTPILVIGFGSIGERHYRNLLTLGYTNVVVYDVDDAKIKAQKVPSIPKLTRAACKAFTVAFVCNPTQEHVKAAKIAAEAGCHLFIEKPLSYDSKSIEPLLRIAKKQKTVAMVACNFRFHQGFVKLEEFLKSKKLGKTLTASAVFSRDITRRGKDTQYAKSYAAQKKGGGVIFDLAPHVVEYFSSLFGDVKSVVAEYGNISQLGIAAEDYAKGMLTHASRMPTLFSLDYFSKPKQHNIEVACERGFVTLDMAENTFRWENTKTGTSKQEQLYMQLSPEEARNDMYRKEITYFLSCVEKKKIPSYTLEGGKKVIKVLEAIRQAGKTGKSVAIVKS